MKIVKFILVIAMIVVFVICALEAYEFFKSFVASEDVQYTLGILKDYTIGAISNIGGFEYTGNEIVGEKLCEIEDFKVNQYIDITVPLEYMVGKIEYNEETTDEAIAIMNSNSVITIYLEKIHTEQTLEAAKIRRMELIENLKSEYAELKITCSDVKEKIALLNISYPNNNLRTSIAIVGLNDKTLIITNSYEVENILEAENYYASLLGEIIISIQERGI